MHLFLQLDSVVAFFAVFNFRIFMQVSAVFRNSFQELVQISFCSFCSSVRFFLKDIDRHGCTRRPCCGANKE